MKSSLIHLGIAIGVCAIAFIGYGIWYAAVAAKSATVARLQDQIDIKMETVSRLAAARTTLAEIADEEATVRGYFVSEIDVVAFIDALEAHGETQGAVVDVLSVSTSGTAAQPTLKLALTVKGTFDAVMRTVGSIEYALYNLSITALALEQEGKDGGWQADLKISVGFVPTRTTASPDKSNQKTNSPPITFIPPSSYIHAHL